MCSFGMKVFFHIKELVSHGSTVGGACAEQYIRFPPPLKIVPTKGII